MNASGWFQVICSGIAVTCLLVTCVFMVGASWLIRHRRDDQPEPLWLRVTLWVARLK